MKITLRKKKTKFKYKITKFLKHMPITLLLIFNVNPNNNTNTILEALIKYFQI